MPVAGNLRGRDIVVELSKTYLKVGVKGQKELIIDVGFFPPFVAFLVQSPPYGTSEGFDSSPSPARYKCPCDELCFVRER